MKNFLLATLFLTFSASSYAQDCPQFRGNFNINFKTAPLKYDYSRTSQYLDIISKKIWDKETFPIGLTTNQKQINLDYSLVTTKTINNNQIFYCSKVKELNLNVYYQPVIYIAKETQNLPCTFKRVLDHEHIHYNIEYKALAQLKEQIGSLLLSNFDGYIYSSSEGESKVKMELRQKHTISYISKFIEQNTSQFHNQIDTRESYNKESASCPINENQVLHKILRQNNVK